MCYSFAIQLFVRKRSCSVCVLRSQYQSMLSPMQMHASDTYGLRRSPTLCARRA